MAAGARTLEAAHHSRSSSANSSCLADWGESDLRMCDWPGASWAPVRWATCVSPSASFPGAGSSARASAAEVCTFARCSAFLRTASESKDGSWKTLRSGFVAACSMAGESSATLCETDIRLRSTTFSCSAWLRAACNCDCAMSPSKISTSAPSSPASITSPMSGDIKRISCGARSSAQPRPEERPANFPAPRWVPPNFARWSAEASAEPFAAQGAASRIAAAPLRACSSGTRYSAQSSKTASTHCTSSPSPASQ
mmetsp:Transcript_77878/g.218243  ORF Transcript_77878/g.218243 Transcript_77878/m.218243 type:complete len:254 (-) Transcript_77878:469-1230(-)